MNMIGAPKHVKYALAAGCDIICAQGGEGGGHTGAVPTSVLIPKVVDLCRGKISPLTGRQVCVVAAGGIFDSRGLALALCCGADAVWVGTRFVVSKEAGAPPAHQKAVMECGYDDTIRTVIFTGRPMRVRGVQCEAREFQSFHFFMFQLRLSNHKNITRKPTLEHRYARQSTSWIGRTIVRTKSSR